MILKNLLNLAVDLLHQKCPETCTEALIRVDIMISNDNQMAVNEFESWEAGIWSKLRKLYQTRM